MHLSFHNRVSAITAVAVHRRWLATVVSVDNSKLLKDETIKPVLTMEDVRKNLPGNEIHSMELF